LFIKASFFLRLHFFICISLAIASGHEENSSVKTDFTGLLSKVYDPEIPASCSESLFSIFAVVPV